MPTFINGETCGNGIVMETDKLIKLKSYDKVHLFEIEKDSTYMKKVRNTTKSKT